MRGAIHPLPQYVFIAWCLVKSTGTTFFYPNILWKIVKVSTVSVAGLRLDIIIIVIIIIININISISIRNKFSQILTKK
jgi:hypothetical protein